MEKKEEKNKELEAQLRLEKDFRKIKNQVWLYEFIVSIFLCPQALPTPPVLQFTNIELFPPPNHPSSENDMFNGILLDCLLLTFSTEVENPL